MIPFVVLAIAMVAIAIAWVMVPLLRSRRSTQFLPETSNVAILRDQLHELDADLANGTILREQYEQARRELERRVLDESRPSADDRTDTLALDGGRRTAWTLAIVIPVAAIGLYALWGDPAAFSPVATRVPTPSISPEQVAPMVAKLAARLEKEPANAEGWLILARSYNAMNRYDDAARAFERAVKLTPDDPNVLADYADALGAAQNSLLGKPTELVMRALAIDRTNWKALALAGTAAFDRKDFRQAVILWEELTQVMPQDAPMIKSLDASIAEARQLGGMPMAAAGAVGAAESAGPSATPIGVPANPAGTPGASPAAGMKVEGTVNLSANLAARASPDDVVFIFARPAEGSRMPVAVLKRRVKDLPAAFSLDDSMAMTPNMTLSRTPQVVVGARISKSGTAMPQSGDLEGLSAPVKPGATGVNIIIDRALP